jgi:UPF0755 protein
MSKKIKIIIGVLAVALFAGYFAVSSYLGSNTNKAEKAFVYIKTGSDYNAMIQSIQSADVIKKMSSFEAMAKKMGLENNIKPGRYEIKPGASNYGMARMFRSGNQKPVNLVVKKYRMQKDLAGHIANKLECDSASIMKLLNDNSYLKQFGLDSLSSLAAFTPNTYEFYWNSDAKKIFEKIEKQYRKFWNNSRISKAKDLDLTPAQVMTMASIVEEETNIKSDKEKIASVYLNRISKGMKLQADPTCKYAVGDFSIRRVLTKHTQVQSPYNTYYAMGLPPSPICTPSAESIDAVLDAPKTDYIFFCAAPNNSGKSNFAATLKEHEANADAFQKWLDTRNIKK